MVRSNLSVELSSITFRYPNAPRYILDIDALSIADGERIGLIGSTGAGKTTLFRLIDGRLSGWTGQAEILGQRLSPNKRPARHFRANVGFVFQEFALIDRASVFENVLIGRLGRTHPLKSLVGRFSNGDISVVEQVIRDVGLENHVNQRVDQLSGGQRQRVGIARCLAQEPRILIADEPVSHLDPTSAQQVLDLLKSCTEARETTLLVSSHQPKLLAQCVERVIGIRDGAIVFDELATALMSQDLTDFYGRHVEQPAA